jgi:hypothetical protein
VTDDAKTFEPDIETCVVKLADPTPGSRYLLQSDQDVYTLDIIDLRPPLSPLAPVDFVYPVTKVGSTYPSFNFSSFDSDITRRPSKFSARGLPPGLVIHPVTGQISGRATAAGLYDSIFITVENARGRLELGPFAISVDAMDQRIAGSWVGLASLEGTTALIGSNPALQLQYDNTGARINVSITTNGQATVNIFQSGQGKAQIYRTFVNTDGPVPRITVRVLGTFPRTLNLQLDPVSLGMTGLIESDVNTPASITGWKAFWSKTNPLRDRVGRHHLSYRMDSSASLSGAVIPEGVGIAVLTVNSSGSADIIGRTALGRSYSSSMPLSREGRVFIYSSDRTSVKSPKVKEVGQNDTLRMLLSISNAEGHPITADSLESQWIKKPFTTENVYPAGWPTVSMTVEGGLYTPVPSSTQNFLNLPVSPVVSEANAVFSIISNFIPTADSNGEVSLRIYGSQPVNRVQPVTVLSSSVASGRSPSINNATGEFSLQLLNVAVNGVTPTVSLNKTATVLAIPATATADPYDAEGQGSVMIKDANGVLRSVLVKLASVAPTEG